MRQSPVTGAGNQPSLADPSTKPKTAALSQRLPLASQRYAVFWVETSGSPEALGYWNAARAQSKSWAGLLRALDALWEQLSRAEHI